MKIENFTPSSERTDQILALKPFFEICSVADQIHELGYRFAHLDISVIVKFINWSDGSKEPA